MSEIAEAQEARRLYQLLRPYFISRAASLDLGRGTAFPTIGADGGAVPSGARFFRTDLGWNCYYDGTRWLTVHEYEIPFDTQTWAVNSSMDIAQRSDYIPYFGTITTYCKVITTNDATNYYDVFIQGVNLAQSAADTFLTYNTKTDGVATWTLHQGAAVTTIPANRSYVRMAVVKTGAPGAISLTAAAHYRLIVT